MTYVSPIDANKAINTKAATYNAVRIQINDPKTIIPEECPDCQNNGVYNGVNLEVNRPSVESCKHRHVHPVYNYPQAKNPIIAEMAGFTPVNMPEFSPIPIAYQTNYINNRTMVNADFEFENCKDCNTNKTEKEIQVPEPNITTTEDEKLDLSSKINFHGINFKANPNNNKVEIIPPVDILPEVDIPKVISNLSSEDFDVQALQIAEIAKAAQDSPEKLNSYVVAEVFSELINIVEKDSNNLEGPTEKQNDTRKKIIINELVKKQAESEGKGAKEIELPYKLSKEDLDSAIALSPKEMLERNKEYSIYAIALLAKNYIDDVESKTGNVIPLTDLPGISNIVDSLKTTKNPSTKIASIDALRYIKRDEYKEELKSLFNIVAQDENPPVAMYAKMSLEQL